MGYGGGWIRDVRQSLRVRDPASVLTLPAGACRSKRSTGAEHLGTCRGWGCWPDGLVLRGASGFHDMGVLKPCLCLHRGWGLWGPGYVLG